MASNLFQFNNPITFNQLEWESVIDLVKSYSYFKTSTTSKIFKKCYPDISTAEMLIKHTIEIQESLDQNTIAEIQGDFNLLPEDAAFHALLDKVSKNFVLDLIELNLFRKLIDFYNKHLDTFKQLSFIYLLPTLNKNLNKNFYKTFASIISVDNIINYRSHPELSRLYNDLGETEKQLRQKLNYSIQQTELKTSLQYDSFDIFQDRYVVPIKSDSYQVKLGQIVARSDSGRTLYIELKESKELNNKRMEILLGIDKIINTICTDLSNVLYQEVESLTLISDAILDLDHYITRSLFADHQSLTAPRFDETLEIQDMFHLLINDPVKNDINLSAYKGLIISGPNTGGKTVLLKTITHIVLLSHLGLFVPASSAKIPFFDQLYYFGNDLQSLNLGLSSFSGEVNNYLELLDNVDQNPLIVIDEIFNSTSSEEASALAMAFIEQITLICNPIFLISTHHQMLKIYMHQNREFQSSHMDFDFQKNSPTYKINMGMPGSSLAIEIFNKISPNNEVTTKMLHKAKSILDNKMIQYETLLHEAAQNKNKLDHLIKEQKEINDQLRNQKSAAEATYKLKQNELVNKFIDELENLRGDAYSIIENIKAGGIVKKNKVDEKISHLKNLLPTNTINAPEITNTNLKIPPSIEVGKKYFCSKLNQVITVIALNGNFATVSKGSLKIKVATDFLFVANQDSAKFHFSYQKNSAPKLYIDGRGMRLEEFQNEVELAVSDIITGDIPFINIIHGHGDGILKGWLRKYIQSNKNIQIDKNTSGNDGETTIILA